MSESIVIRYKKLDIGSAYPDPENPEPTQSTYHKYLVYLDENGDVKGAVRAGPSFEGLNTLDDVTPCRLLGDLAVTAITAEQYNEDFKDFDDASDDPSETVDTGTDLSSQWSEILAAAAAIATENHPYHPHHNSLYLSLFLFMLCMGM